VTTIYDILLPDAAEEMTRRGPRAGLEVIEGDGHPPALNVAHQLNLLDDFLG
jgi:hypothetical protein